MLCAMDAAGYAENVNLYTAGHALRSITRRLVDRRSGLGRRCGECDAFGHLDGGGRRLGRLCRARSQQGGCDEKQVFHG